VQVGGLRAHPFLLTVSLLFRFGRQKKPNKLDRCELATTGSASVQRVVVGGRPVLKDRSTRGILVEAKKIFVRSAVNRPGSVTALHETSECLIRARFPCQPRPAADWLSSHTHRGATESACRWWHHRRGRHDRKAAPQGGRLCFVRFRRPSLLVGLDSAN
jgi:hypothetical protein